MPQNTQKRQKSTEQESRILLIIHQSSQRQATSTYTGLWTTLRDRLKRLAHHGDTRNGRHKLTRKRRIR